MRIAGMLLVAALISIIPAIVSADDSDNSTEIMTKANDLFNNPVSPAYGNSAANITIVEFYDYQCGHCKISEEGFERILREDNNLKIVFKDFPKLGPLSVTAATATLASKQQGADKYWNFRAALMDKKMHLSEDAIYEVASANGIDTEQLKKDMKDEAIASQIQESVALGRSVGVRIVPSFIVGKHLYIGEASYERIKQIVADERKLEGQPAGGNL